MYLSHACVSFTYNWYYLHLIRVPFLPLSLSLSLLCFGHMISLLLLLLWRHSTGCHSQRSNLALCVRPHVPRSCYVGLLLLRLRQLMIMLTILGRARLLSVFALRLSLFGLRFLGFSESNGELCVWEPFRVARCPHCPSPPCSPFPFSIPK